MAEVTWELQVLLVNIDTQGLRTLIKGTFAILFEIIHSLLVGLGATFTGSVY